MEFTNDNNALCFKHMGETVKIEAWGVNSLRVRSTMHPVFDDKPNALTEEIEDTIETPIRVNIYKAEVKSPYGGSEMKDFAELTNGRIKVTVNYEGVLSFYKDNNLILREHYRSYDGTISKESRCLKTVNREWKGVIGGSEYSLAVKFESDPDEMIWGMGQYQQNILNLKGCMLELAQRNSQISVPFAVSSLGYGFLWNNPAVGQVVFGKNVTEWTSKSCDEMDYYITVGDNPKEILKNYTKATGHAGRFPEDMLGLWQCKLRYRTQDEVLEIAHKYEAEGIKLDAVVIDFFHWTLQGDWKFDPKYWPNPKAMTDELHRMGIKVIVSVWPSVDRRSENFYPMLEKGLLIKTERGAAQTYDYQGDCVEIDVFNPEAREYVWNICKKNYRDLGIDYFWLDNSEPDYGVYDFDHYRYFEGPALKVSNMYPQWFSRTFYDEMCKEDKCPVNLLRSAWAGSQKYGNVVWSGDVPSTFESFEDQIVAGLNMGLAGIPWWTTDIGGFMTDDVNDPEFKELLVRWFQFAVFSPVLRMHGDRGPYNIEPLDNRERGGGYLKTGQPNELWSYGKETYDILRKYLNIRYELKDYIKGLFDEAAADGSPLIRTMFYEFPDDLNCREIKNQYMFGDKYLVAPIVRYKEYERSVYLPSLDFGHWKLSGGDIYEGGQYVTVKAPIDSMPVFEKISQ